MCSDVYSYNFPNDRRPLKFLGRSSISLGGSGISRLIGAAYFVFLLETIQTTLTGSDVYYWLIAGFGDVERLAHSHFGGIDIGVMTAFISLIVQGYFSYRIWVLNNKQLSWMCWIIAVVCIPDYLCILQSSDDSLNTVCADSIKCNGVVRHQSQRYVHSFMEMLYLTYRLVEDCWEVWGFWDSSICKCTRSGQSGHIISHIA